MEYSVAAMPSLYPEPNGETNMTPEQYLALGDSAWIEAQRLHEHALQLTRQAQRLEQKAYSAWAKAEQAEPTPVPSRPDQP